MPQSHAQIYVHIVFSTKERQPFLDDQSLREEMHKVLGGICNAHGCPVLRVGGVADHVHILCRLGRTITLAEPRASRRVYPGGLHSSVLL